MYTFFTCLSVSSFIPLFTNLYLFIKQNRENKKEKNDNDFSTTNTMKVTEIVKNKTVSCMFQDNFFSKKNIKIKREWAINCILSVPPLLKKTEKKKEQSSKGSWQNKAVSSDICFCCSVSKSCPTLGDPMNRSTSGFPVLHCLPELAQTHAHWVSEAIQPSHPLLPPSPAHTLSQHQGLFQWVASSHQVSKVLALQLQHQSFQWIFRVDFL